MFKLTRIWILFSWSFLTVGILLGSWWAYHELGWGGWWFWDPVENASLMPWLLATASIHSITQAKLNRWTLIYIQGTFLFSILGTFFVRSGLLSSVHSFATDSTRGFYLLFFLLSIVLISLLNYAQYSRAEFQPETNPKIPRNTQNLFRFGHGHASLRPRKRHTLPEPKKIKSSASPIKESIEQILLLQNFYLCVICGVVLCGTLAPLVFHWFWNREVGTGASFYNGTLIPLFTSVFFVLFYTHSIQFFLCRTQATQGALSCAALQRVNISRKFTIGIQERLALAPVPKELTLNVKASRNPTVLQAAILAYYFLLFFFLHVFVNLRFFELNLLNSVYAAICILLVSSIILSQTRASRFVGTMVTSLSSLPSRHLALKPNFKNNRNLEIIPNIRSTENSRAAARLTGPSGWSEMNTAHTGVVLFIIGILLSTTNKLEYTEQLHSGPSGVRLGAQICCLRSIDHSFAPTFHSICANLLVYQQSSIDWSQVIQDSVQSALSHGEQQRILQHPDLRLQMRSSALAESSRLCMFPEKRFYYSNQSAIATKVAIHSNLFTDFYSLIGTGSVETGWFTTIMKLPFIFCIWLGFFIGMLGGALRLRKQLQKSKLNWF